MTRYAERSIAAGSERVLPSTLDGVDLMAQVGGRLVRGQVAGDEQQLLAGTLKDGDRVDLVASITVNGVQQLSASRVVLRDLLVLKAPESTKFSSKLGSNPNQPFSAMIAVTDSQAQKFFYVMENGKWTLELRPVTDAADSPESVDTAATVLGDGLRVNERKLLKGGRR